MTQTHMAALLEPDLVDRLHKSLRVSDKTALQLAGELGLHRNTLARYLSGRSVPDRRTLVAWALATGVPLRWLMEGVVPRGGPNDDGWAPWDSNPQPTDYVPMRMLAVA